MNNHSSKIRVFLMLLICQISLSGKAQMLAFTRSQQNRAPEKTIVQKQLKHILNELSREHKVSILFEEMVVQGIVPDSRISKRSSGKLEEQLDDLLTPCGLRFSKIGQSQYVVFATRAGQPKTDRGIKIPAEALLQAPSAIEKEIQRPVTRIRSWFESNTSTLFIPDSRVSGKVLDESGETLPGVSILLKGSQKGTTTGADGTFTIDIPDEDAILVFSYVGYLSQEVAVGKRTDLTIHLQEDEKSLEEVVVVGYGTQRKANLTGAVSTVDSKALENRPTSNLANALQGTTPGLVVTRTGGQPGSENIAIQVRGATSANGNVNPLLLVDGVPAPIITLQTINPNDIESISVLKDAAAAAIYGAQAAGGVILVTTKRGAAGKTTFEYSGLAGFDIPLNVPRRLSLLDEAEFSNLARANAGIGPEYDEDALEYIRNGVEYIVNPADTNRYLYFNQKDLIKQIVRDRSYMQNHNLTARGGTDKLNFLASLGYYKKQGVFRIGPDQLQRYNARFNINAQLTSKLSLDSRITYTLEKQEAPVSVASGNGTGLLYQTYRLRTRWPLYTPEGRLNGDGGSSANNTYAQLKEGGYNNRDRNYFDGVFTLKLANLVKGLQLRAVYGIQYRLEDRERFARTVELWHRYTPAFYLNNPNTFEVTRGHNINTNLQFLANYDFTVGNRHNFQLLGGYQWEEGRFSSVFTSASNLVSNNLPSLNLGNDLTKTNSQTIETFAYQSYFGRLNYSFADRYLFEATIRVDESSRLAPGMRVKLFPAASVGWNLHNEDWFSAGLPFFSEFKLRGSWGQLGSALGNVIGFYDYMNMLSRNSNLILGTPETRSTYFFQQTVPSSSLTWETVETTNVGMDIGLLKNRLQLSADYYVKYNRNMLTPLQLPATFGVGTPRINNGELKSWGWETELRFRDKIGKDFNYSLGFNLADNQNRLLSYVGRRVITAGTVGILEGYPLNSMWGFQTDGYFQTKTEVTEWAFQDNRTGPGDVRYIDRNDDGRITAGDGTPENHGDLVYLGTNQPRYLFGLNGNAQWKGFDFSFFFQGVGKRTFFPGLATIMPLSQGWMQALDVHRDYWTENNRNAAFPRPYLQGNHNYLRSDKWAFNGQYIRLKNIQVGYTVPGRIAGKAGLSRARIYFSGQDILTFSRLGIFSQLVNPENQDNAGSDYPIFAAAALGLNLTF